MTVPTTGTGNRPISLAVRDFVALARPAGDIDNAALSPRRARIGTRVHQLLQAARPDGYRREVYIQETVCRDGLVLRLHGRIDGVCTEDGQTVIEEIKSTDRPLDGIVADPDSHHFLQARVYAALLGRRKEHGEIIVRLTYASLDATDSRSFQRRETVADLEQLLEEMLDRVFRWLEGQARRRRDRNRSLQDLQFPFPAWRNGQRELADAVAGTLSTRSRLLSEAPTGTGKTIAVLFPALQHLGRDEAERIFYLTARGTGAEAPRQALALLFSGGIRLLGVEISAREKACILPVPDCRPGSCPRAAGYYGRLPAAIEDARAANCHFSPAGVRELADRHELCPFELAHDLSTEADLVIGDVNYLFDPAVRLRRHFENGPADTVLLCDEVHQLPDRVRAAHTVRLERKALRAVLRRLPRNSSCRAALQKLDELLKRRGDALKRDGVSHADWQEAPEELAGRIDAVLDAWEDGGTDSSLAEDAALVNELKHSLLSLQRLLPLADGNFRWLESRERGSTAFALLCLHPGDRVADGLKRVGAAVLFSATLSPEAYYRTLLGLEPSVPFLGLPSPFPPENLLILETRGLSLRYRDRSANAPRLAALLSALARESGGHTLAFFPSHAYLAEVLEQLILRADDLELHPQARFLDPRERENWLERFAVPAARPLLGLAVMGGIFGESIDLPGNRLGAVVVIGTGIPAPDLERELLRAHYEFLIGDGFHYAYTWPGFQRVVQAAGRLIRTETDRGILALIDDRFAESLYRSLRPQHWPEAVSIRSPREAVLAIREHRADSGLRLRTADHESGPASNSPRRNASSTD